MTTRRFAPSIFLLAALAGCATQPTAMEEGDDPPLSVVAQAPPAEPEEPEPAAPRVPAPVREEGEVPLSVAGQPATSEEVVIEARARPARIRHMMAEAQAKLRDVDLQYEFTGHGSGETLRGRPVAFAAWSERRSEWVLIHLEIPRPPVRWKPGRGAFPFTVRTPGIEARHVRGTGAERLMFSFTRGGEALQVYGRKFPVFDNALVKRKQWREVVRTAQPLIYLPYTDDTFDDDFRTGGRDFLLGTARRVGDELRSAGVASQAFPGQLLADVIPPEVVAALAVIEQTDDADYVQKGEAAFGEVLGHYGLEREGAFRYSVSRASALGPLQFTNAHGNGTYSLVVHRCAGAKLDPDFERGATSLANAMKAATCLLDLELARMPDEILSAYRANRFVLGMFPVAAYNGGPRNVAKLSKVLRRMKLAPAELRRAGPATQRPGNCPCLWKAEGAGVRAVPLPRYNNENRWYLEKYQGLLGLLE